MKPYIMPDTLQNTGGPFESENEYIEDGRVSDDAPLLSLPDTSRSKRRPKYFRLLLEVVIISFVGALSFTIGLLRNNCSANETFELTSMKSPVVDSIEIEYQDKLFNNSLLHSNIYREDPSPAVDQAWHNLGVNWNNMTIPVDVGSRIGMPSDAVHVPDEFGGGYMGILEVFHQLHCLDLLRKASFHNYNYYRNLGEDAFFDSEEIIKAHVGHCIDMIRLQLMCSADIGVVPFVWTKRRPFNNTPDASPHFFPEFQNVHKCRDFDAIRQWYLEHQHPEVFAGDRWPPRMDERVLEYYT